MSPPSVLILHETPPLNPPRSGLVQQYDAPNPYKLALGLLKHPDRQLSGVGDRGRSKII